MYPDVVEPWGVKAEEPRPVRAYDGAFTVAEIMGEVCRIENLIDSEYAFWRFVVSTLCFIARIDRAGHIVSFAYIALGIYDGKGTILLVNQKKRK